jgi:hypothetical protein
MGSHYLLTTNVTVEIRHNRNDLYSEIPTGLKLYYDTKNATCLDRYPVFQ